jgi:hypothetical protein
MMEDMSLPVSIAVSFHSFRFLDFHPHEFLFLSLSGFIYFFHNTLFTSRQASVGAKKGITVGLMYVNVNWKFGDPIQRKGLWNFSNNCWKGSTKLETAGFCSPSSQLTHKHVRTQCNNTHLLTVIHIQLAGTVTFEFNFRPYWLLEYPHKRH